MQLPEVNKKRMRSEICQTELEIKIQKTINNLEEEIDYKFEPYEIDNVLLRLVKKTHQAYLKAKLGTK